MRRLGLIGLVLLAGCFRENPDYTSEQPGPAPTDPSFKGPGTIDMSPMPTFDLATMHAPDQATPAKTDDLGDPNNGVSCGVQTCVAPAFCCQGLPGGPICAYPDLFACTGGKPVTCDGPEDCPSGGSCCATLQGAACAAVCPALSRLCHRDSDCETGDHCCPIGSAYTFCKHDGC